MAKRSPKTSRSSASGEPADRKLTRRELLALAAPYSGAVAALLVSSCGGSRRRGGGGGDDDDVSSPTCEDTCTYAHDGDCDDGGSGSSYSVCDLGTDCDDCGPRDGAYSEYSESYYNYTEYSEYSEGYYNYPDNPYYELYPNYDNYG